MSCFNLKAIILCANVPKNKKRGLPSSKIPPTLPTVKPNYNHHSVSKLSKLPSYGKFEHAQYSNTKRSAAIDYPDHESLKSIQAPVTVSSSDDAKSTFIRKSQSSNGRFDQVSTRAAAVFAASRTMSTKGGESMRRRELSSSKLRRSNTSVKSRGQPPVIMFSTSSGVLKPPQVEIRLPCTLAELCFGCVKQMRVYRDIVTSTGQMSQEDELLTVNVEAGWTHGTRITFQGSGSDERSNYSSDVVFTVTEKVHEILRRRDDKEEDLEMEVVVPLVDALAGYELLIPLLSGELMSLFTDEVITPGFEMVIEAQGMPDKKDPSKRGDLRVKFDVEFPKVLSYEQRSEICKVLSHEDDDDDEVLKSSGLCVVGVD